MNEQQERPSINWRPVSEWEPVKPCTFVLLFEDDDKDQCPVVMKMDDSYIAVTIDGYEYDLTNLNHHGHAPIVNSNFDTVKQFTHFAIVNTPEVAE